MVPFTHIWSSDQLRAAQVCQNEEFAVTVFTYVTPRRPQQRLQLITQSFTSYTITASNPGSWVHSKASNGRRARSILPMWNHSMGELHTKRLLSFPMRGKGDSRDN